MDVGLDTGPILATRRTPLGDTETRETLGARLAAMAAELLDESLVPWLQGELPEQPQPPDGTTLTRPLQREHGRLDPSQPAGELERQVRAYAGWPGTYLETDRGRLIVHQAEVAPFDATDEPGSILVDGDGLALATADGLLKLIRVQPPGGRPMSGAEYRRGRRDLPTRTLN
jgi:methionyl-tRNA formyltransferase